MSHGFTEALYAWTSMRTRTAARSRGFGLSNVTALLAGPVAAKRTVPVSAGTLRAEGPTFAFLLVGVIVLTAGLLILPALTFGPIVEGLSS